REAVWAGEPTGIVEPVGYPGRGEDLHPAVPAPLRASKGGAAWLPGPAGDGGRSLARLPPQAAFWSPSSLLFSLLRPSTALLLLPPRRRLRCPTAGRSIFSSTVARRTGSATSGP